MKKITNFKKIQKIKIKKEGENQTKNWSKASQNRTSDKTVVVNRSSVKPVNRSLITECSVSRIIWAGPFVATVQSRDVRCLRLAK